MSEAISKILQILQSSPEPNRFLSQSQVDEIESILSEFDEEDRDDIQMCVSTALSMARAN